MQKIESISSDFGFTALQPSAVNPWSTCTAYLGEPEARFDMTIVDGPTTPLHRLPLAARNTAL
jgi:hypothetical protein